MCAPGAAWTFTHLAGVDASTAASNAVLGLRRRVDGSAGPRVTFTAPRDSPRSPWTLAGQVVGAATTHACPTYNVAVWNATMTELRESLSAGAAARVDTALLTVRRGWFDLTQRRAT